MELNRFDPIALAQLADSDPEAYNEIISRLSVEWAQDALKHALAEKSRVFSFEGYEAYYEGIYGEPMLPHTRKMEKESFEAFEQGKIWLCLGFRSSRKTESDQVTKKSWLHGLFPDKTGVITGANDPNAKLIAKSIAEIIDKHPFFKLTFPHVVVYKERGWGAEGYWIRKTHELVNGELKEITLEEWTKRQVKAKDPSFIGGGYKSSEINGKHPTLYLGADDLHDIDSSQSPTEREDIKKKFFYQILPTVPSVNDKRVAWVDLTGVPFAETDTYAELIKDGCYFTKIPIMTRSKEGEGTYINGVNPETGVVYDDIVGWWNITAPELYGAKSIIELRKKKSVFYQMYMIDINIAKTGGLTYYEYPHNEIGFDLPTFGGADPSGIDPDYDIGGKKGSSFALAYVCKLPKGGAVIKDGVLKPMGFEKAKNAILQAQAMFPKWETTGVEDVSYGKSFMQFLRRDGKVRFLKSNLKDIETNKVNNKGLRFLHEVHPYIESGLVRISDEKTPFLDALRFLMDNFWDIDDRKPHEGYDAADSVYHALKLMPEILMKPTSDDLSPQAMQQRGGLQHPFFGNVGVRQ